MAYNNYKASLWEGTLLHECKERSVYRKDCWEDFKGDIKSAGDEIIFNTIGTPTITVFDTEVVGSNPDMPDVEEVPDTALRMKVHQLAAYNFEVGDIDAAQGNPDQMKKLMSRTADAIASVHDKHIAAQAQLAPNLFGTGTKKVVAGTAGSGEMNVMSILDMASEKLGMNSVGENIKVTLNCSYRFLTKIREARRAIDTDNSGIIELGAVGKINNFTVKASVNCASSANGTTDYIMIRTGYAVGFADGVQPQKAYVPEKKLADAVKGASLYQAKILLPKEVFLIPVTY